LTWMVSTHTDEAPPGGRNEQQQQQQHRGTPCDADQVAVSSSTYQGKGQDVHHGTHPRVRRGGQGRRHIGSTHRVGEGGNDTPQEGGHVGTLGVGTRRRQERYSEGTETDERKSLGVQAELNLQEESLSRAFVSDVSHPWFSCFGGPPSSLRHHNPPCRLGALYRLLIGKVPGVIRA
jgi:hypothetical protein